MRPWLATFFAIGLMGATIPSPARGAAPGSAAPQPSPVADVETLNDQLRKFAGRRIQVDGRIVDKIDARSVMLQSGGLWNDQIVVVAAPRLKDQLNKLPLGREILVTGVLLLKPVDPRTDDSWTLTTRLATGFRDVKAFLIADQIAMKE